MNATAVRMIDDEPDYCQRCGGVYRPGNKTYALFDAGEEGGGVFDICQMCWDEFESRNEPIERFLLHRLLRDIDVNALFDHPFS